MKKELLQVKDKLAERAVIERAKGLLIEHKNMSEDQAYKTLRKMAMDQGKKISVVAHEVCDVVAALSA
nr:ANTAR domain-containing protein [Thiomicrorhabdus cannonii]